MPVAKKKRRSNARVPHWPGGGGYGEEVVGESFYRASIESLCGWGEAEGDLLGFAVLEPDPANVYDKDAVKVLFGGSLVGHLSRESAQQYKKAVVESPEVYDPPMTTAYARVSRLLLESGEGAVEVAFSIALDMRFDAVPSDVEKNRPPVSEPILLPRLKDYWYIQGGHLIILAFELDRYTTERCAPGASFDVWQPEDSDAVRVYAQGSIGGSGLVIKTTGQALRNAGFASLAEFDPRVHTVAAGMVIASAKLPLQGTS